MKDENSAKKLPRADLVRQTITVVTYSGTDYRTLTSRTVGSKKGWYLDLPGNGERVIVEPIATGTSKSAKIIFTTFTPSTDPCEPGGFSWLMQVNMKTGGELEEPVYEVPGRPDGTIDDKIPSGVRLSPGSVTSLTILGDKIYFHDIEAEITTPPAEGGDLQFGLRSWRQLLSM